MKTKNALNKDSLKNKKQFKKWIKDYNNNINIIAKKEIDFIIFRDTFFEHNIYDTENKKAILCK